ncbi:MAG TPA: ATP-binding protein [Verrucomicrobiae bacterium]|nr:ATP-binding protein [Verrucomicrobiae bacterium]
MLKAKWLQFLRNGAIAFLVIVSPLLGWSAGTPADDAMAIIPGAPLTAQDTNYDATNILGSWIWAAQTFDRQTCQFWRAFEIPTNSPVTHALLVMTVDNEFTLYLDGRALGHGDEWRELFEHDVTHLMSAGKHTLAVKAYNSFSYAGMIFGLQVDFADGNEMEIKSDESWRIVPDGTKRWERKTEARDNWPPATIIAELGGGPWWSTPTRMDRMPTLEPIKLLFWQTGWFQVTILSVCGFVILISFRLTAQVALHQKDRRLLQQERERIARDIHDDLGSRMTQLVLHGEVALNELPPTSPTRPQLDRICEESREMLSRMDEILWAVNPQRDTLRDFTSYVCDYVQEFLKPTGIQSLFEIDPEMATAALDLPLRRSLLMAIKETLNNAVKHSEATELRLLIHVRGEVLSVVAEDNGKGFDPGASKARGNGLANLTQRMSEFGGSCAVTSQPGKGCQIAFDIPLPSLRRRRWGLIWNSRLFSRRFGAAKPPAVETQPHVRPAA